MLTCDFTDAAADLPESAKTTIAELAVTAAADASTLLPLERHLSLTIAPTATPLADTCDNAYTESPEKIHWFYDQQRDPTEVAKQHLRQAFFHEAFHAARFRRLAHEAGLQCWSNVALGEGLACVFARQHAAACEPWTTYDPLVIQSWAQELLGQPWGEFDRWKFQHEDGRDRVAFRVGVWLASTRSCKSARKPSRNSSGCP